jgi:hypothetical protein
MNKKNWILIAIAIVLGGVYIIHFSNWFKPKVMAIAHNGRFGSINFTLGNSFQLTSIKVVSVSALESNKYALPMWELKSDSNSAPVKLFSYGERIQGMKPAIENMRPEPLVAGTTYRILVEAGSLKAQHDFTPADDPRARNRARSAN